MKNVIKFPLENGEFVLVEVDEPSLTDSRVALDQRVTQTAQHTFESALSRVKPVADAILIKMKNLNEPASEVEVKFGIKMTAGLGVIIASGSGEVNYEITLRWKRELKNDRTP